MCSSTNAVNGIYLDLNQTIEKRHLDEWCMHIVRELRGWKQTSIIVKMIQNNHMIHLWHVSLTWISKKIMLLSKSLFKCIKIYLVHRKSKTINFFCFIFFYPFLLVESEENFLPLHPIRKMKIFYIRHETSIIVLWKLMQIKSRFLHVFIELKRMICKHENISTSLVTMFGIGFYFKLMEKTSFSVKSTHNIL